MAAYRVLREIKKLGYKYIQHTENGEGEDEDDGDVSEPKMEQVVIDTSSGKEPMTVNRLKGNINDTAEAMKAHYSGGSRLYCNDVTEKCLKLCVDYPHVYHHLPKSDTLDIILVSGDMSLIRTSKKQFPQFLLFILACRQSAVQVWTHIRRNSELPSRCCRRLARKCVSS